MITKQRVLVGPPIDLADPVKEEDIQKLLATAKMQLRETDDYFIGPGDVISIQLVGRSDILGGGESGSGSVQFLIGDNPQLVLPYIGALKVHDKTAAQLQEDLKIAYAEFIKDPNPLVIIEEFNRNQIMVLGSVNTPGRVEFEYGDTLLDALFKAGGLTYGGRSGGLAPGRYLKIYRERLSPRERATLTMEELLERLTIDERIVTREEIVVPIQELLFTGTLTTNVPVFPNDIVFIPPGGTVSVRGYVESPSVVFLGPSVSTISQVINETNGLRIAADNVVDVIRPYPDGQDVTYRLQAYDIIQRKDPDFVIRDGDEIVVYGTYPGWFLEFVSSIFRASINTGANATYSPTQ